MKKIKALLVVLVCVICALALSACHVNNDPWPASSGGSGAATVEATDVPAQTTAPSNTAPDSGSGYNG